MPKYQKKPVVIEAIQLTVKNHYLVIEFVNAGRLTDGQPEIEHDVANPENIKLHIPTLEGLMTANAGDWIIKGIQGEFYPCKPDIFEATYEPVEE